MSRMLQNERRAALARTRPQIIRAVPVTQIPEENEPDTAHPGHNRNQRSDIFRGAPRRAFRDSAVSLSAEKPSDDKMLLADSDTQVEDDVQDPKGSPKAPEGVPPPPSSIKWPFLSMLAPSVCVRAIQERFHGLVRSVQASTDHHPSLRLTVLAGTAFLGVLICAGFVAGEIDLNRLMPGAASTEGRPVVVVQNGRLTNTGAGPALNLEVTRPRYRLIGTLAVGQSIELPAPDFAVQFEWTEGGRTQRATRSFKVGDPATATNGRVAGANNGVATAARSGAPTAELAPPGIAATYDPATHLLTVTAQKPVEVRVDGFLLRPISRTEKEGAQFRYVQANVLVLGQDIRQGDTVQFEVVFTQPQDYYSIPIYVREPGKPFVYFTVSVALRPVQEAA